MIIHKGPVGKKSGFGSRAGPARLSSARLGSPRLGPARLGSSWLVAWLGSTGTGLAQSLRKAARFKMIGLTDSIATITAYANDEGYETVFEEPLRNFARPGDLVMGISGSGNSENVLRAMRLAGETGCRTVGLTTGEGGALKDLVELALAVPSSHMGRLEDCFFIMTHVLCYAFMESD